ncbi:MAG: GIY-YIG nuclease family protein [Candidatus Binatia bacterium]
MSFWAYILRWADGSHYTGHTDNLEDRIAKDQAGEIEGYTSTRLPIEPLFSEEFSTREQALACERQIKGWSRSKKEAFMRGDWAEVSRLARRRHPSRASG